MTVLLAGTISVKAALEEKKRPILQLIVNPKKRSRDIAYLIAIAKKEKIPVVFSQGPEMNEKMPGNGGVILEVQDRGLPDFSSIPDSQLKGLCVYVSGVEDPYNMGSIARSLYAAGASMLIVQKRVWQGDSLATLLRSSAGAWERLPVCSIENEEQLLERIQLLKLPLVCASRDEGADALFEAGLEEDLLLAVGGAMRGLSSRLLEAPGRHLYIPYGREFRNALDSTSAAAVFAFEWTKEHARWKQ